MEYQLNNYQFEKPVIIVAAPRSGSTLLFEQLAKSEDFWTIGIESHQFIENIPEFNVTAGKCDSNRLTKENATLENISHLRGSFYQSLRNNNGVMFDPKINHFKPRFLEKTPKNTLRISLLNEVFPNAKFIHTKRDFADNALSIYFQNLNNLSTFATDFKSISEYDYLSNEIMLYWEKSFASSIHTVFYEDVVNDYEK